MKQIKLNQTQLYLKKNINALETAINMCFIAQNPSKVSQYKYKSTAC